MSVELAAKPVFHASLAEAFFRLPVAHGHPTVTADGKRFQVAVRARQSGMLHPARPSKLGTRRARGRLSISNSIKRDVE
jgi:hypothetical protein